MNKLKEHLASLVPGPVADIATLAKLLAACWDEFNGSDEGGMAAYKLLNRMENVRWTPPILSFVVERHGWAVCGSTRDELQHWELNLDTHEATITKSGYRQREAVAARLPIKSMAEVIAQAILDGKEDDRLHRLDDNTVKIRASSIFPSGSGFKRTVEGRRKALCQYIDEILAERGWVKQGWNVFAKKQGG